MCKNDIVAQSHVFGSKEDSYDVFGSKEDSYDGVEKSAFSKLKD